MGTEDEMKVRPASELLRITIPDNRGKKTQPSLIFHTAWKDFEPPLKIKAHLLDSPRHGIHIKNGLLTTNGKILA